MGSIVFKRVMITLCVVLALPCATYAAMDKASAPDKRNDADLPATRHLTARMDARVELMSVIFHLAGNNEYNQCSSKPFMASLDGHFAPYRDHPAVQMAKRLRDARSISYDAVMSIAVHITDANSCSELVPLKPRPSTLDSRWKPDDARRFLAECRNFVKDSNFPDFLAKNKLLYDADVHRLQRLVDTRLRTGWFSEFFGPRDDMEFDLVVSILNGPGNYGVKCTRGERTTIYCILGAAEMNTRPGTPDATSAIVHEYCHSYCNPIVEKHAGELKSAGTRLFGGREKEMQSQAYGDWQIMMCESMVRACEVRYAADNSGPQEAQRLADYNASRGFVWTKELADVLGQYEKERKKYPDLDAFFPVIVEFFNFYADSHK